MAYSGCPLMREHKVTFHAADAVTGVRRGADAFCFFVKINGKTVRLAVTFPAVGGVRLTAKPGFFAADDRHTVTYSGQKVIRMTAGAAKADFRRDTEKGFVLTVYGKNGTPAFTLSGADLQFGIDEKGKCGRMRYFVPFAENEVLYGLGERYDRLDRRGLHAYLWNVDTGFGAVQGEAYQNVPLMHSTAGYALFFNTMFGGNTDSGVTVSEKTLYDFNGDAQDLFIFTGTPYENLDSYTRLTGRPILPPRWAYEYWMGASYDAWRLDNKDPLIHLKEYLDGYAAIGIHHDAACYGETGPCQTKEAYEMLEPSGCRMLFWNYPAYGRKDSAALLHTTSPAKLPHPMMKKGTRYVLPDNWLDFTHPDAKTVMRHKYARYFDWGLKGAMIDFGEFIDPDWKCHNGKDGNAMHNEHSYWYAKTMKEVFEERCGDDYVLFERSGCAGAQHYCTHFGGDQKTTFEGLNQAYYGMLSASASGLVNWGSDIGGLGGFPSDETYIRWLQMSTFSPLMRAHAAHKPHNPWNYGDPATDVFKTLYWWRENMLPYTYHLAIEAHKTGLPLVLPMPFVYPDDADLRVVEDQYFFGSELMVAPVLSENRNWRTVQFPAGHFTSLWSGETVEGGRRLCVNAPLDTIPVYLRDGAILPLTLPKETLLPFTSVEDTQTVPALLVTPALSRRTVTLHTSADDSFRLVSEKPDGGILRLDNTDGMACGALLLFGAAVTHVKVDGKEVPFTNDGNKTTVRLENGFKTIEIF